VNARGALAVVCAIAAGCAQPPRTPEALETVPAPTVGALQSAYDRSKWRWVRNPDGRALLSHADISPCFVDPQPPLDVHDAGFTLQRSEKTIGGARYTVLDVYEQRQFWEAVYTREGAIRPTLGVYAAGRCREEAERILLRYEEEVSKKR